MENNIEIESGKVNEGVKGTVQTSSFGKSVLEQLEKSNYFPVQLMGFRFAIAYAVSQGITIQEGYKITDRQGLTWGTTNIDPHGQVRIFIEEVYLSGQKKSHEEVYKLAECLAEEGLKLISEKLQSGQTIGQLFS
jgi:hypothetical protein